MATTRELADYYVAKLVLQYRTQQRARDTIAIFVKQALLDNLAEQLLNAFTIDTAVGAQLDILGKYVGVPRNIGELTANGYFSLWPYAQPTLTQDSYQGPWNPITNDPPLGTMAGAAQWWVASTIGDSTSPLAESWLPGDIIVHTSGPTFVKFTAGNPNGNGFTTYADGSVNANALWYSYSTAERSVTDLTDASYRTILKLQIILNSNDGTLKTIMDLLKDFFGGLIALTDNRDMTMTYVVISAVPLTKSLLEAYLPRPMGVGITVTIVSPAPGGGDYLTTEDGFTLTTEDGAPLVTEST